MDWFRVPDLSIVLPGTCMSDFAQTTKGEMTWTV